MKKLNFGLFLALFAVALFTSCEKDDEPDSPMTQNIVELAEATPELSTLVQAINHADLGATLSGTDAYTVFAPTNAAFDAFLSGLGVTSIVEVDKDVVARTLLYHVVGGTVKSTDLTGGYVGTAAMYGSTMSPLDVFVNLDSGVKINESTVTTADVEADNGVVHIVDKVLALPSVVTHALDNPNFSVLVQALTRDDLGVDYVGILTGSGPFTVFAPTNAAFTALLEELGATSLADIDAATLNAVLQYHVVADANVLSGDLSNGQEVTTFGGSTFTVDTSNGVVFTDARGRTSTVVEADVQADNGVVHAIDKVILP